MHTNDPLRFIPFHRRYQTHNGNGVPLGLTFNAPDTNLIWHFADVLSGSRGVLTQEDGSKIPNIDTQSGIPFLHFDGNEDCLTESFTLAQPHAVILAIRVRPGGGGSHDILCDDLSESAMAIVENATPSLQVFGGAPLYIEDRSTDGKFCVLAAGFAGDQSFLRLNGSQILSGYCGTNERTGLVLGCTTPGRTAAIDVIACIIPKSIADVSVCEAYLATLLP